eukprot:Skav222632  [mRNA]  locus=scaffold10:185934:186437:+ [translate_table: standard]
MGLPIRWYVGVLAISQLSVICLLGLNYWEQRHLRLQLTDIHVGTLTGQRTGVRVAENSGEPDDPGHSSGTRFGTGPPLKPQVGQIPLFTNRGSQSGDFSLAWQFLGLCTLLVSLVGIGLVWIWAKRAAEPILDPLSPTSQKQVAQRQLAELRLRRHGFGESKSAGTV